MLRDRITKAQAKISLKDRVAEGMLEATPSTPDTGKGTKAEMPSRRPLARSGIVGNVLEWWSRIRAPLNTRIVNNILRGWSSIEVLPASKPPTGQTDAAEQQNDS
jgi:hypothetical protein